MAKHKLQVMGREGDRSMDYDVAVKEEVQTAEAEFARCLLNGYIGVAVNPEGDPRGMEGKQIKKFDPGVERILMVPALAGG